MTATFLVGAIFYLYRDVIRMNFVSAAAAAALVLCFAFSRRFAEPVLVVFGGYAVFYFALMARPTPLASITARYDISYGLYLYCWPIQSLLVYSRPDISPWAMFVIAWTAAALCGLISWIAVERPIQRRVHGKVDRGAKTSQGSMQFRARTEHPSPGSESL
jgi:peptidoglycan/LPS O-acetylase OafA/YrhL